MFLRSILTLGVFSFNLFLLPLASADPHFQYSESLSVNAPASVDTAAPLPGEELFYEVNYQVDCRGRLSEGLPGLAGEIAVSGTPTKTIRFDLFQGKHHTLIALGPTQTFSGAEVLIKAHKKAQCKIHSIQSHLIYEDLSKADFENNLHLLALKHSPFLVVRADQYNNRTTDIPLELTYSTFSNFADRTITLRYTYFFSDEDSKSTASEVDQQMSRYGRMTDIEWIYEVTFDSETGKVLRANYQGGVERKLARLQFAGDHSNIPMEGQYWPGSHHPILYNVANNNVFSDAPYDRAQKLNYVAYHPALTLDHRIHSPDARELFQISDRGIYMYLVSELEIRNEGKLPVAPSNYLYFAVTGSLTPNDTPFNLMNGAFKIEVNLVDSSKNVIFHGMSSNSIDRFGEDLYGQGTLAAVQIPETLLKSLREGQLQLGVTIHDARRFIPSTNIQIQTLDAFTLTWNEELGRYQKTEIPSFQRIGSPMVELPIP